MPKETRLYIPSPCHENWNTMTPTEQGKFCAACSKQVIDFSLMSDSEVRRLLSAQTGKVCGRFNASQLERPLVETRPNKKKSWWMAACMPLLLVNNKQVNKNMLLTGDTTVLQVEDRQIAMGAVIPAPTTANISGKVYDEAGNPLAYVTITGKDLQNSTVTDSAGNFSIDVDTAGGYVTLVASYVGYETMETRIMVTNGNNYVDMHLAPYVSGLTEIVAGKLVTYHTPVAIDTVTAAIKKICGVAAFKIYPNPVVAATTMHLKIKKAGSYQLQFFDNASKLINSQAVNTSTDKAVTHFTLPASIPAGIYYLRLINEQTKKASTEKLIIQ